MACPQAARKTRWLAFLRGKARYFFGRYGLWHTGPHRPPDLISCIGRSNRTSRVGLPAGLGMSMHRSGARPHDDIVRKPDRSGLVI